MERVYANIIVSGTPGNHPEISKPDDDDLWYACEFCDKRFRCRRGLRVHLNKMHSSSSPMTPQTGTDTHNIPMRTKNRSYGTDGMPTCRFCHRRFNDWYAFDRHIEKKVCTQDMATASSSLTTAMQTSPLSDRTFAQRTDEQPLLQQTGLIESLQQDWQNTLENKLGLRARLQHHCVVCNQWFQKGWHLTHHGHRQHKSLFDIGKLHRNELLLQSGLGTIKWNCPFCLAVLQSANLHHCPVLLQIAVLLSAPSANFSNGVTGGNRCREPGNGSLQGALGHSRSGGERRACRTGSQEEAHRTIPRYRIRVKSRPQHITWKIQRQAGSGSLGHTLTTCNQTRRQHQYSSHGNRVHAVHESRITRAGPAHVDGCGSVEGLKVTNTNSSNEPIVVHHDEDIGRRVAPEGQAAPLGRAYLYPSESRSGEEGGLRLGAPVCIQEMGQGSSGNEEDRPGASLRSRSHGRSAHLTDQVAPSDHPPLPQHTTAVQEHVCQDCPIHDGNRMAIRGSTSSLECLRPFLHEFDHELDRSEHAPFKSTTLPLWQQT